MLDCLNVTYPVCCLGGCLLTADDLPDDDHHADFRALHSEPLLGSVQDLADLDWDKVLFLLSFAFSPGSAATKIVKMSTDSMMFITHTWAYSLYCS